MTSKSPSRESETSATCASKKTSKLTEVSIFAAPIAVWILCALVIASFPFWRQTVAQRLQSKAGKDLAFSYELTGQFGDSFGGINALATAFAALFAYRAFRSQQRQLEQQQREFQIQRCEEHLFFLIEEMRTAIREVEFRGKHGQPALLLLENELIGPISQHPEPGCITSRSCGELGKLRLQKKAAAAGREFSTGWKLPTATAKQEQHEVLYPLDKFDASLCLSLEDIQRTFYSFMEEQAGAAILHCLRMQAEILKYIDSLDAESAVKQKYAALFASQLSDPELHLLLYYGLSDYAAPSRLMTILKEYQVFRPLCQKSPKFIWHRIPELTYYHSEQEIEGFGRITCNQQELPKA